MQLFLIIIVFILIAVGLAVFMLKSDKGEREPISALWLAVGFGLVGAVIAAIVENKLISINDLKVGTPFGTLLSSSMAVGIIEESCKFLPLAIFIYSKRY